MKRLSLVVLAAITVVACQDSVESTQVRPRRDSVELAWPRLPETGLAALTLQRSGERWQPTLPVPKENASRVAQVSLPGTSGAPFEVREGAMALRVTLQHQEQVAGRVRGDAVLFPKGWRGSDVVVRALADGVEDFIALDGTLPPTVEYDVELEGVAGVRLVENALEFLTADGDPRLRMAPPRVLSAQRVVWADVKVSGCQYDRSARAPWGRPVTAPGSKHCRVALTWELEAAGYPALLDPAWTTTGDLPVGRAANELVSVGGGQVMSCGGFFVSPGFTYLGSCDLYSELTGTWATTGSMTNARAQFALNYSGAANPGPRVFAAGGENSGGQLASVERWDAATGLWTAATALPAAAAYLSGTTMPDGRVVYVGGQQGAAVRLAVIAVHTPSLNTTPAVASLATARCGHTATLITGGANDGRILIAGGLGNPSVTVNTAEVLNPATSFSPTAGGVLASPFHFQARAVPRPDGTVLIAGGIVDAATDQALNLSEVWGANLTRTIPFQFALGVLATLPNGNILAAGGATSATATHSNALSAIYDVATNTWTLDGPLSSERRGLPSAYTTTGKVLTAGGFANPTTASRRTELFDLLANGAPCAGPGLCQSQLCVDTVCCNAACAGNCDACNLTGTVGTCTPQPNTFVCRGATDAGCDVEERCTGSTATCPADGFASNTVTCRPSAGLCDPAESCPGGTPTCPADVLSPNTVTCRPDAGPCDLAERCDGAGAACPADTFLSGVTCRASAGVCDVVEACSGAAAACPSDAFNSGMTCRPAAGVCDVAEQCSGLGASCPADGVAAAATTCRAAAGTCDVVELCSGTSTSCGADVLFPQGTTCNMTFTCSGMDAGCPTTCTLDSECAVGARCLSGVCVIQVGPGNPCTLNAQCTTGFCADGVCCNSACNESCATCNLAGSVGTCSPVAVGNAGDPTCSPYLCDGASRTCPGSCSNSTQCAAGFNCVGGACVPVKTNGTACGGDTECVSGFCTDGVCCNTRCEGGCQACNVAGAVGTCTIAGRGDVGAPVCAPFVCDGKSGACPTACEADADCGPPAFCENKVCSSRTRGHVGFGCAGCSAVDGASLLGLLGVAAALRRRARGGGR